MTEPEEIAATYINGNKSDAVNALRDAGSPIDGANLAMAVLACIYDSELAEARMRGSADPSFYDVFKRWHYSIEVRA